MTVISLKSFAMYRPAPRPEEIEILYGAEWARRSPGALSTEFCLGSVPLPCIPRPLLPNGVVALVFGTADIREEMARRWEESVSRKATMLTADVLVEVEKPKSGLVHAVDLPSQQFINIRRTGAELQTKLLERIAELAARSGDVELAAKVAAADEKEIKGSDGKTRVATGSAQERLRLIGSRLDLLARVFTEDSEYKHIRVIVASVFDPELKKLRQIGFVRRDTDGLSLQQTSDREFFVSGV